MVVTGDFFQLPPVSKGSTPVRFAFESNAWRETIQRAIKLTKVFRQKDEGTNQAPQNCGSTG
jgi:ATP-dependent DNA helicase PIF1